MDFRISAVGRSNTFCALFVFLAIVLRTVGHSASHRRGYRLDTYADQSVFGYFYHPMSGSDTPSEEL